MKQRTLVALVVVLALGLVLRLIGLTSPFWVDEVMTVRDYVRLPVGQIVTSYAAENQHPLYSLLAHLCVVLFGEHEWSVRLPAVLFGVAGLAAVFRLARRVLDEGGALLATLLLAVSGHAVWFAQDARGYTGLLFFFVLATTEFFDLLRADGPLEPRARHAAAWRYAIWFALASWTHLTALFAFLGHALVWIGVAIARRRGESAATARTARSTSAAVSESSGTTAPLTTSFLALLGGGALALLLYSPMARDVVHAFTARAAQTNVDVVKVTPWTRPSWALEQVRASFGDDVVALVGLVAAAAIAFVGFVSLARGSRSTRLFVLLHLVAPPVALAVLLLLHRHLYPRFFFFEAGFVAIVLVRGAQSIGAWLGGAIAPRLEPRLEPRAGGVERRSAQCGIAVALLLVGGASLTLRRVYAHPKQDFVGARDYVESHAAAGDSKAAVGGPARLCLPGYYAPAWTAIRSTSELATLRAGATTTWIAYTLPDQVREEVPDVAALLEREFDVVATFEGSLGDGTVFVARSKSSGR